jgi:hypothetical protein
MLHFGEAKCRLPIMNSVCIPLRTAAHLQKKKAFAFASCMEHVSVLGAGRRVASSAGTTQREATAASSPSWPRQTKASTGGGPGGTSSLDGQQPHRRRWSGLDGRRHRPCCAMSRRLCCAEPRHYEPRWAMGDGLVRAALSRAVGGELCCAKPQAVESEICRMSTPYAQLAACTADFLLESTGYFPPPIPWPLIHPCAWPCCSVVHFVASLGSAGQQQATSVGEPGRWRGAGVCEGDDASGGSKQVCNFASDERGESILALLSPQRHFASLLCLTVRRGI